MKPVSACLWKNFQDDKAWRQTRTNTFTQMYSPKKKGTTQMSQWISTDKELLSNLAARMNAIYVPGVYHLTSETTVNNAAVRVNLCTQ